MKNRQRRILAAILSVALTFGNVFAEGNFSYTGEKTLFSEGFESGLSNWVGDLGVSISSLFDKNVLKLSGTNRELEMKETTGDSYGVSAKVYIKQADAANGGYAGVSVNGHKLEIYPKEKKAKITDANGKELISTKVAFETGKWNEIKLAQIDGTYRAMLNNAVIMTAFDDGKVNGKASVISDKTDVYFNEVSVETESSYYYENFENGTVYSACAENLIPEETKGDSTGLWVVEKDEDKNVLTTKGYSTYAKIVYPMPKTEYSNSYAVVANVKSGDWNADGKGGFSLVSRYGAGNMNYRLRFHNNVGTIEKVSPSYTVTKLAESGKMKNSVKNYYETALETINESDGGVTINAYCDGKLIASAKDTADPYTSGDVAVEFSEGVRPLIDEINCISIDKPLYDLYAEGRKNKSVDVYFNDTKLDCDVIMEGILPLMDAEYVAELINATVTENTETSFKAEKDGISIEIQNGASEYTLNGSTADMQTTARIVNGKIYVPVNALAEPFGAMISYDEDEKKVEIDFDDGLLSDSNLYTKDNIILAFEPDYKSLRFMKILGSQANITGDETPVWKTYYIDDNTARLNATQYTPGVVSYGQMWQLGSNTADSLGAVCTGSTYDEETGKLVLSYSHEKSDVDVCFELNGSNVKVSANVTNKYEYPLQFISVPAKWRFNYSGNNTVILDAGSYHIEYENISYHKYSDGNFTDGFMINGDNPMSVHFIHGEVGKTDKVIRGDESHLAGPKENLGYFTAEKGTVVYAKTGEQRESNTVSIGVYDNMKAVATEWMESSYPETRTLMEKQTDETREKMPETYLFYGERLTFNEQSKLMDYLPGHAQLHIGNSTMHKRTDADGNEIGAEFDAFPNYFPPSTAHGTEEDLGNLITHVTKDLGHFFMPRQSLYYFTEGSDMAKDTGVDDESSLAIQRLDGQPQHAMWAEPGYLTSPSSKAAQDQYKKYFEKWTSWGANTFFTNVIGAVNTMMHRYDFNKDAAAPDTFWNSVAEQFKWYSDRNPVFTEDGSAIRVPYTTGYMTHLRSGNDKLTPYNSYMTTRGNLLRVREDINALVFSKYLRFYPHNLSTTGQSADKIITFSLLYNQNMKTGISAYNPPSDNQWRYYRNVAMMAETIQPYLYGKELLDEIDYDESTGIERANYEGSVVIGNLTDDAYCNKNDVIAKHGFDFKSSDGLVSGGIYDEYNGHAFDSSKIIVTKKEGTSEKIYALTTAEDFDICVPTDVENAAVVAHYSDGTTKELAYRKTGNGVLFTYPAFPVENADHPMIGGDYPGAIKFEIKTAKEIPYVEIKPSDTPYSGTYDGDSVIIKATLGLENYTSMVSLPNEIKGNVRVENYTNGTINGTVNINGDFFGKATDITLNINQNDILENYEFTLNIDETSVDCGADLNVTVTGINPISITDKLTVERMTYPDMGTADEMAQKYNIDNMVVDWNMDPNDMPENVTVEVHGAQNPYGTGYILKNGDYIDFKSDNLIFTDKVYFEVLLKYNDLRQYSASEQKILYPINGTGHTGRQIEFRYLPSVEQIRLLITSTGSYCDVINRDVQPQTGKWHHVIACYDGATGRVIIDGKEVTHKYAQKLHTYSDGFRLGGLMDAEIAYVRIGGK